MPRSRIESLLSSFPKLIKAGEEHTFVETEAVRYVYQVRLTMQIWVDQVLVEQTILSGAERHMTDLPSLLQSLFEYHFYMPMTHVPSCTNSL